MKRYYEIEAKAENLIQGVYKKIYFIEQALDLANYYMESEKEELGEELLCEIEEMCNELEEILL